MSKKYTTEEFINKANLIHNIKYNYSKLRYTGANNKIIIGCNIHGYFTQKACDHLFGYGCPKCNPRYITSEKFIEKAKIIHNDKYDYSLVEYINAKTKVNIICKIHGIFQQRTNDHLKGCGCPHCKKSLGENLIKKFLNEKQILFETEKKFDKCKGIKRLLPFDFYLPNKNILIEYDGQQHFNIINYWGGKCKFEEQLKTDKIKNEFALSNGIKLIRISYCEINNINKILEEVI